MSRERSFSGAGNACRRRGRMLIGSRDLRVEELLFAADVLNALVVGCGVEAVGSCAPASARMLSSSAPVELHSMVVWSCAKSVDSLEIGAHRHEGAIARAFVELDGEGDDRIVELINHVHRVGLAGRPLRAIASESIPVLFRDDSCSLLIGADQLEFRFDAIREVRLSAS